MIIKLNFEELVYFSYTLKGYASSKYNFLQVFLQPEGKNYSHPRFLNLVIGNLPACFQIYGLSLKPVYMTNVIIDQTE